MNAFQQILEAGADIYTSLSKQREDERTTRIRLENQYELEKKKLESENIKNNILAQNSALAAIQAVQGNKWVVWGVIALGATLIFGLIIKILRG